MTWATGQSVHRNRNRNRNLGSLSNPGGLRGGACMFTNGGDLLLAASII